MNLNGFHIAKSKADLRTTYLGEKNEFVIIRDALLFADRMHAADYANFHGIRLGKEYNAVVRCKCFEFVRADHPKAKAAIQQND